MKHFTIILLAAGLAAQTYHNGATTREGPINLCGTASGTNTITCSMSPAISGYVTGTIYSFVAAAANTGATTLNINSKGAIAIRKNGDTALAANDIKTGQLVSVQYDGTNFQMLSHLGNASSGGGSTLSIPFTIQGNGNVGNAEISNNAHTGICHRFSLQAPHAFTKIALQVASASGTCAGTCGLAVALYDSAKSRIAQAVMTSGGTPDYNTIGAKQLAFGATITMPAGKYYVCYASDSIAAAFPMVNVDHADAENNGNVGTEHGYQGSLSTGSGGSISLPSTLSGNFNTGGTGGRIIPMVLLP